MIVPASESWVVHGESVLPASVTMPETLLSREVVVLPEVGSDQDLLLEQVSEVGQRRVRARWRTVPVDVVGVASPPGAGPGVTVWTSPRHVELTGRTDAVVLDEDRAEIRDVSSLDLDDVRVETHVWRAATDGAVPCGPVAVVGGQERPLLSSLARPVAGRSGLWLRALDGEDLAADRVEAHLDRRAVFEDGRAVVEVMAERAGLWLVRNLRGHGDVDASRLAGLGRCRWIEAVDVPDAPRYSVSGGAVSRDQIAVGRYVNWRGVPFRLAADQGDVRDGVRLLCDTGDLPAGARWQNDVVRGGTVDAPRAEVEAVVRARTRARLSGVPVEVVTLRTVWAAGDMVKVVGGHELQGAVSSTSRRRTALRRPDGTWSAEVPFDELGDVEVEVLQP